MSARLLAFCWLPLAVYALDLGWPTDNDALRRGDLAAFYQPTAEGSIQSAMFGCVRRGGQRFHEGIDIRCLRRDRRGEPLDEVRAVADGTVAFINHKPYLSNYGRYVVLAHRWNGVEVYTLYAHLASVVSGLKPSQNVAKGQVLGILGRSTNTREGIPRERAHLHFEVTFLLNPHFHIWYPRRDPKAPPFGNFNGQNLYGLDPAALLLAASANPKLNFAEYVARQPIAFTVLVPAKPFPWLTLHSEQIQAAPKGAVAAYEIGATAWGTPIAVWPRADCGGRRLPAVARVDEAELARNGCRELVRRYRRGWILTDQGRQWLELLTFAP
ncbi:MAG: M23 family metallopeptidase [Verrucomicrobiae bacterium]|nr:M23 family metallopeptidase [Verrucomicrobiae bacterium]